MKPYVGGNWHISHLTDRTVELWKDDYVYRRFTGRDGRVLVRAEPGMSREQMIAKAVDVAQRNDAELALRVGKQLIPSARALAEYTGKQMRMVPAFGTPEDPNRIGVKSA